MHELLAPTRVNLELVEEDIVRLDKEREAAVLAGDNSAQNALRLRMAEAEMQARYLRRAVR